MGTNNETAFYKGEYVNIYSMTYQEILDAFEYTDKDKPTFEPDGIHGVKLSTTDKQSKYYRQQHDIVSSYFNTYSAKVKKAEKLMLLTGGEFFRIARIVNRDNGVNGAVLTHKQLSRKLMYALGDDELRRIVEILIDNDHLYDIANTIGDLP